jgi:hypothetical protein
MQALLKTFDTSYKIGAIFHGINWVLFIAAAIVSDIGGLFTTGIQESGKPIQNNWPILAFGISFALVLEYEFLSSPVITLLGS